MHASPRRGTSKRRHVAKLWTLAVTCFSLALSACGLPNPGIRYPQAPRLADGALHVISFDMGQADAMLVLYRGKSLLIDAGEPRTERDRARHRIPRRLDALLGSRHLDYVLVTHYHTDHVGAAPGSMGRRDPTGLFALLDLEGCTIGTLLDRGDDVIGKPTGAHGAYAAAVLRWTKSGVVQSRRVLRAGDAIDLGPGLDVKVMVASANGYLDRLLATYPRLLRDFPPSENDYSVGVKLTLGDFELFAAGDLSGEDVLRQFGRTRMSYNDIESQIAAAVGPVEVYRVNHHGSEHSSNACFAEVLRPQVSVFSTGPNSFGHPSTSVYDRLRTYGDVYITGGADKRVADHVHESIVGDDVEVIVAPTGNAYWVNGTRHAAVGEQEEELTRLNSRRACTALSSADGSHYANPQQGPDAPYGD